LQPEQVLLQQQEPLVMWLQLEQVSQQMELRASLLPELTVLPRALLLPLALPEQRLVPLELQMLALTLREQSLLLVMALPAVLLALAESPMVLLHLPLKVWLPERLP
jgi:hypothetical protein